MSYSLLHRRAGLRVLTVWFCLAGFLPAVQAQLFFDDFTRANDPGSLSPWVAQAGSWTVTGTASRQGSPLWWILPLTRNRPSFRRVTVKSPALSDGAPFRSSHCAKNQLRSRPLAP